MGNLNLMGIYIIKNKINNKIYVGSTNKTFKLRFETHSRLLDLNKHENPLLQNAWNKYGKNSFIFEIIESYDKLDVDLLLALEKQYIIKYNSLNKEYGYNICSVGKSRYGTKWSEKSKMKRSGNGNPMFGKGYLRTGVNNPMFGKILSESHKYKISISLSGRKRPDMGKKLSKPVIMSDLLENELFEFPSYSDAMIKTKILHISEVCNGKRKTAGGYIWKWKK